jgi:hypothetical protein
MGIQNLLRKSTGAGQSSTSIQSRIAETERAIADKRGLIATATAEHADLVDRDADAGAIEASHAALAKSRAFLADHEGKLERLKAQLGEAIEAEKAAADAEKLAPLSALKKDLDSNEAELLQVADSMVDLLIKHHGLAARIRSLNMFAQSVGRADVVVPGIRDLSGYPLRHPLAESPVTGSPVSMHPVPYVVDKETGEARRATKAA